MKKVRGCASWKTVVDVRTKPQPVPFRYLITVIRPSRFWQPNTKSGSNSWGLESRSSMVAPKRSAGRETHSDLLPNSRPGSHILSISWSFLVIVAMFQVRSNVRNFGALIHLRLRDVYDLLSHGLFRPAMALQLHLGTRVQANILLKWI